MVCRVRRRLLLREVPSLRSTSRDVSKRRGLAALQGLRPRNGIYILAKCVEDVQELTRNAH